jgi:hypothetical protein
LFPVWANLENYLSTRYTFSVGKMVCEYCNFIAKNQQALSAHQRGCLVRKNMTKTEVLTDINTELSSSVLAQQPTVLAIDTKVKDNKVKKVKV